MSDDALFPGLDDWDPNPLRKCLRKGGFHRSALEALGMPERWLRSDIARAALLGRVPPGSPLEVLLRLFTLGDAIDGACALRVLGDASHGLLALGFLAVGGGTVRSIYQLTPMGDGWIACDFRERQRRDAADYVMGLGPSSILLASLTPLHKRGRALELASGIGWLSGQLAQGGMAVVATDLNARALSLGRFTARLAGTVGIEFRHGDGFACVSGERFDLIVANPPYVQSPGGAMLYKEAPVGDPICARLLRDLPEHLAPGGIAVVLLNWSHQTDDDWSDGPLAWIPATGTRRWLFRSDCSAPADYAWKWIAGDLRFAAEAAAVAEMHRWLAHYQSCGVTRVSGGFVIVQQCAPGDEWTRRESRAAEHITAAAGGEVLRVLQNQTWLATAPDLLETRFDVPEGVRAEASLVLGDNGWAQETIRLTSPARLSYDGQIDANILRLLAVAREGKAPSALVAEISSSPGFSAVPDLPQRITALVHELVHHGMLVPAT
ncbi:MAG: methyltransferase [Verrucomicrobiota bacterium]